jgi:hypothetical protein
MPQSKERKRAYMKEYMAKRRAREKEMKAESEIRSGNLNYGLKPVKDVFPCFKDWVKESENEGKTFHDWVLAKIEWSRENRVVEQDPRAFEGVKGTNMFHETEEKSEEQEKQKRQKQLNDKFKTEFGERAE